MNKKIIAVVIAVIAVFSFAFSWLLAGKRRNG